MEIFIAGEFSNALIDRILFFNENSSKHDPRFFAAIMEGIRRSNETIYDRISAGEFNDYLNMESYGYPLIDTVPMDYDIGVGFDIKDVLW